MKKIVTWKLVVLLLGLLLNPGAASAAIQVKGGSDIPLDYIRMAEDAISGIRGTARDRSGTVTVGSLALEAALREDEHIVCATFISRFEYEQIQKRFMVNHVPVVYYDPSPNQQLKLARQVAAASAGKHQLMLFNSDTTKGWWLGAGGTENVEVRTRSTKGFRSLLESAYKNYIVLIPADNHLLKDVVVADLVSVLLENNSAIISFTPNIRSAAGSVYYDRSDYLTFVVQKINSEESVFRLYPPIALYSLNKHVLSMIGIDYKDSLTGTLSES